MQAIRLTPHLGSKTARDHVPGPFLSLLETHTVAEVDSSAVEVELTEMSQVRGKINDILCVCVL